MECKDEAETNQQLLERYNDCVVLNPNSSLYPDQTPTIAPGIKNKMADQVLNTADRIADAVGDIKKRTLLSVLQVLFAIIAFSTVLDFSINTSIHVTCSHKPKHQSYAYEVSYPFVINKLLIFKPCLYINAGDYATTRSTVIHNFSYDHKTSAEFYVAVGIISLIFAPIINLIYGIGYAHVKKHYHINIQADERRNPSIVSTKLQKVFKNREYKENKRKQRQEEKRARFVQWAAVGAYMFLTVLIGIFWLCGLISWIVTVYRIKNYNNRILNEICPQVLGPMELHVSCYMDDINYGKLTISILFGVFNLILWIISGCLPFFHATVKMAEQNQEEEPL